MLKYLLNTTNKFHTYEIVEFPDDSNETVLFATIECSEVASMKIIKALNATSVAGSATSKAKAEAAKINGAKGGRPRKEPDRRLLKCCGNNMEAVSILPCCDRQYWCDSCGDTRHRFDCSAE